jgi:CubicO group peptidase (beta-lactamase class C family)
VRTYAMTPLLFDPGTKEVYASAGINTAARVVEVISGMPYDQFLEQRIFRPLGMTDTTFWPTEDQLTRHPSFYKSGPNKTGLIKEDKCGRFTYPLSDRSIRYPIPGSGLFSTTTDMARFCQMFMSGGVADGKQLISQASIKLMTTKQTPPSVKYNYGFGWATDHATYSHGGSYHTFMHVWPADGLVTIFMLQIEGDLPKGSDKIIPRFQDLARARFKQHP